MMAWLFALFQAVATIAEAEAERRDTASGNLLAAKYKTLISVPFSLSSRLAPGSKSDQIFFSYIGSRSVTVYSCLLDTALGIVSDHDNTLEIKLDLPAPVIPVIKIKTGL